MQRQRPVLRLLNLFPVSQKGLRGRCILSNYRRYSEDGNFIPVDQAFRAEWSNEISLRTQRPSAPTLKSMGRLSTALSCETKRLASLGASPSAAFGTQRSLT